MSKNILNETFEELVKRVEARGKHCPICLLSYSNIGDISLIEDLGACSLCLNEERN